MTANLSSASFTGREANMWLNPPAFQPAVLSVLEHSSEDSMGKHCTQENEKPQPEKQLFPPSHVCI